MRKICLVTLIFLLLLTNGQTQTTRSFANYDKSITVDETVSIPTLLISGAEDPIEVGEAAMLRATHPEKPKNLQQVLYSWNVLGINLKPKTNIAIWPDGSQIFFAVGKHPTQYAVQVEATYVFYEKEQSRDDKGRFTEEFKCLNVCVKTSGIKTIIVKVIDSDTPPVPTPTPTPDPEPNPVVLPDGKFKLAPKTYEWATTLVDQLPTEKARCAQALVNSFQSITAAIAAGTLKKPIAILEATNQNNREALKLLNVDKEIWSKFFGELQDYLYNLYQTGKLTTPDQYREAWLEIIQGLEAVSSA